MKTLIFLLAAALASPAFGQDQSSTTTDTESTSETTTSSPDSYSETATSSSTGAATSGSENSALSGPATDLSETDSSLSGTATDMPEADPSLSGTASDPSMTAPAAAAPTTPAPGEQASRTYRESMEDETKGRGFYIEPAIFGSRQDNDLKGAAVGPTTTSDANGFGLDLKFGGHLNEMFFLAADARYERSTFEDTALEDTEADVYNWGPSLGFQAPMYGLRAWGTYIVDGVYNPEAADNGLDLEFQKPYGWRGGVGVRFAKVSLNVEYEDLTYRTTDIDSFGTLDPGTSPTVDFDQRGYAVSLSFPFEL